MAGIEPVIIIGSGLAGYTLAREFRKLDATTPLILIAADAADFYSKPMLSNAVAKQKPPQALPTASAEKMAADLSAEIVPHTRVTQIDPEQQSLVTDTGTTYRYSKLILATGSQAIRLPLQGDAVEQIHTANDLQSYAAFHAAIQGKQSVAIIGAGLIGCEFANDLRQGGYEVHVIDIAAWPLGRLLPEVAGDYLKQALADVGVNWWLDCQTTAVQQNGDQVVLQLNTDNSLQVDTVLFAVGLQANTVLAEQAGLQCQRAIVVDRFLQTSATNIYALGDCAEVDGHFLPFVMPLMNAARALAKTLAGEKTAVQYPAMPVVVKTPDCPTVVAPARAGIEGEWQVTADSNGVRACYHDHQGKLAGFALLGDAVSEKQQLARELPPLLTD